jgi:hypothetical protein
MFVPTSSPDRLDVVAGLHAVDAVKFLRTYLAETRIAL